MDSYPFPPPHPTQFIYIKKDTKKRQNRNLKTIFLRFVAIQLLFETLPYNVSIVPSTLEALVIALKRNIKKWEGLKRSMEFSISPPDPTLFLKILGGGDLGNIFFWTDLPAPKQENEWQNIYLFYFIILCALSIGLNSTPTNVLSKSMHNNVIK